MNTVARDANSPTPSWASLVGTAGGVALNEFVGLVIEQFEPCAVVTMALGDTCSVLRHNQRHTDGEKPIPPSVHGGALATLVDVACGAALTPTLGASTEMQVTTDMNLRYYRQPRSSPLTAEARVVHRGRRLADVECVVKDGDDRLIVGSHATYMILAGPQEW